VPSHSSMLVERLTSSIGTLLEQQLQVSCCPRLQAGVASDQASAWLTCEARLYKNPHFGQGPGTQCRFIATDVMVHGRSDQVAHVPSPGSAHVLTPRLVTPALQARAQLKQLQVAKSQLDQQHRQLQQESQQVVARHESLLQQAQQEVGQLLRDSQHRAAPSSGAAKELQRLSQQVQVRVS
jgi:hypothetical protein